MGTAKKGVHSAVTTRTVLSFVRPAGIKKTLLTVQEQTASSNVEQNPMHGDGGTAPIAIVNGTGEVEWAFSIATHEYNSAIAGVAKAAGITIKGEGGLLFNIIHTSIVDGLEKDTQEVLMASIGDDELDISSEGNRRSLSGMAINERVNGALQLPEAK